MRKRENFKYFERELRANLVQERISKKFWREN